MQIIFVFVVLVTPRLSMMLFFFFFLMIRRPPRSTLDRSSAASDVYKRQGQVIEQGRAPRQKGHGQGEDEHDDEERRPGVAIRPAGQHGVADGED